MKEYPSLTEMDIKRFDEISRYTVFQDRPDRDVLRITYKRKKGSLLPKRKTFHFGRSAKMINDPSARGGLTQIHEISPFLQKVMLELDSIIGGSYDQRDRVKVLMERIEQLEKETMLAAAEMRSILEEMK